MLIVARLSVDSPNTDWDDIPIDYVVLNVELNEGVWKPVKPLILMDDDDNPITFIPTGLISSVAIVRNEPVGHYPDEGNSYTATIVISEGECVYWYVLDEFWLGEITTSTHWDCECEKDYINNRKHNYCCFCRTERDEQPDSRIEEVVRMLQERKSLWKE